MRERIRIGHTVSFETEFDFDTVKELNLYKTSKSGLISLSTMCAPLGLDEKGKPIGFIVQMQDITERKEAEFELQKSEQRNQMIVDAMSDLVLVFDSERRYCEYYGDASLLVRSWDEMVGLLYVTSIAV